MSILIPFYSLNSGIAIIYTFSLHEAHIQVFLILPIYIFRLFAATFTSKVIILIFLAKDKLDLHMEEST